MKITLSRLLNEIYPALKEAERYYHPHNNKYSYAIEKNIARVDPHRREAMKDRFPHRTKEVIRYVKKINALKEKFGKRDENGQVLLSRDGEPVISDLPAYQKRLLRVNRWNRKAVHQIEDHEKWFQNYLLQEVDVNFHLVSPEDIAPMPANVLSKLAFMRKVI